MDQSISPDGATAGEPDFLTGYVSEEEYARRRGVSMRTCQRDRQLRQAPPHVKFGRAVFYSVESVRRWLKQNEREADRTPAAPRTRGGR
ncbi:MAG: hypothetical protein HC855_16740 [Rhizobiales bacterium]|nr:hypothetical protein [Hyphomicrobiales bacterium]